jgi:hypothetical protein
MATVGEVAEHGDLVSGEVNISRMVKYVNEENASGQKKFSVGEFWRCHVDAIERIYTRGMEDPAPVRAPKFPYKPPANSPPRRKPISKRTPPMSDELLVPEDVQPASRP